MALLRLITNSDKFLKSLPTEKIIEFLKEHLDVDEEVWTIIEDSVFTKELTSNPDEFNKSEERIQIMCDMFKSAWEDNPEMSAGQLVSHYDITYRVNDFELYERMKNRRI